MFIEFAGPAGVGKTTVAAETRNVLAQQDPHVRFLSTPRLSRSRAFLHLARRPDLLRRCRELEELQNGLGRPILPHWRHHVATAHAAAESSAHPQTVVVAQETIFHWLKKFPHEEQQRIAGMGLPLPDLLVHLVSSPADLLKRVVTRPRRIDGIENRSQAEVESLARAVVIDLLRSFPSQEAAALLQTWGAGRAGGRLSAEALERIHASEAERAHRMDAERRALPRHDHLSESARNLGITVVRVESRNEDGVHAVAQRASEHVLAHSAYPRTR